MQFKNNRTGDQRTVHLKIRILCRRPDQDQRTVFHKRQQIILLPLIETVNLINKKYGLLPIHAA